MSGLDVAIVGMACVYPGAPDLETYWRNIERGFDAITEMPPDRIDASFYDPASTATDRIYTRRGGFIDRFADFDPVEFSVMPVTANTVDPDHMLALRIARSALADAGYLDRTDGRERSSVILGRGGHIGPGMMRWIAEVFTSNQLVETLRDVLPSLTDEQLAGVKAEFQARTGIKGPDSGVGLIPNLVASRIAHRFDFGGSAYTVDAACASSLVAVSHACEELARGNAYLVLAGGVHISDVPTFWTVFSQLRALSPSQQIKPFDRTADGLLIGEGIGMLVLKRLADAEHDSDRIYAVIKGAGTSSDGHAAGLLSPRVEGQVLALERAWQRAGLDPNTVGLVEAHGTAMAAGDAAEIETLRRFFGPLAGDATRAGLGSVKSMIGHTMPAAGAAGLIKAALAVHHGVLPPSLHCVEENEALAQTRFRVLGTAEPWEAPLRRAAVNAFGFGGINAHVVLDSYNEAPVRTRRSRPSSRMGTDMLLLAAPTQQALIEALQEGHGAPEGPWRIAVSNPTPERIATATRAVEAGRERFGRDGIYFSGNGVIADGGKIAFLFPGLEAQFDPQITDVAERFGLDAPDLADTEDLRQRGLAQFLVNRFYSRVLDALGLRPDIIAGHSIGEWSGMVAAGILSEHDVERFIATTLQAEHLEVPDVAYLAAGASAERAMALVTGDRLAVSHDNCLHQSILCGPDDQIAAAADTLRHAGVICEVLPFKSGFHSASFAPHVEQWTRFLTELQIRPAAIPLYSATTCAPYPDDEPSIRQLHAEHLVQAVRFRELILRLYDEGVRTFVQVGPGRLGSFVDDVLLGQRHLTVSTSANGTPGLPQLTRAAAELFVAGAALRLDALGLSTARPRTTMRLDLGTHLLHIETKVVPPPALPTPGSTSDPLFAEFAEGLQAMVDAQREIAAAFASHGQRRATPPAPAVPAAADPPTPVRLTRRVSVEDFPELVDHCLIPQPANWPHLADRWPTAPMTMLLELMSEAVLSQCPGQVVVRIEQIVANRWMHVLPPIDLEISVDPLDGDRFRVALGDYASGTVVVAASYPTAPLPSTEPLRDERPSPVDVDRAYVENWLFHGPAYQGLVSLDTISEDGSRSRLRALPAIGGTLDNAGQAYGLWVSLMHEVGRIAMPVRIGNVQFFDPEPAPGTVIDCLVWKRQLTGNLARADLELVVEGRLIVRIEGWEDWLFETAGRLYPVFRFPGRSLLARPEPQGFVLLEDPGWLSTTLDLLRKRYLSAPEQTAAREMEETRRFTEWLRGRIAAKDAVRRLLFESGSGEVYPSEVEITTGDAGRPLVSTPTGRDIRVSLAHKDNLAVAIAAEGVTPGIDIERIEERADSFLSLAFNDHELALLPLEDRATWTTRFWCAKEAAGKALGSGLAGNPKSLAVSGVAGSALIVDQRWIDTEVMGNYVVAWTRS